MGITVFIIDSQEIVRTEGACNRCGGVHDTQQCRFRNKVCTFIRKWGHIEKACRAKKGQKEQVLERVYPQETTL